MKKKAVQTNHDKSLKTFYLYATAVIVVILVSLVIRGIVLYQQNLFNPSRHFTLAVTQKGSVKEIISFNPQIPAVSLLKITDKQVPYASLAEEYGIPSDGYVELDDSSAVTTDTTALTWYAFLHSATLHTNLTFFDTARLFMLSKNVATNNESTTDIALKNQSTQTNTQIMQALTDPDISSESISIQIINASNISGMGQRLGKILTNMGANVVDVSSSQTVQKETAMAYFGDTSFTLDHLKKLLQVTPKKLTTQPIANIVITIGTDQAKTTTF
jgi:hypothetical protein